MKWSKYNALLRSERHGWFLYNSLSNSFVQLADAAYQEVERIRAAPDEYDASGNPGLYLQLLCAKAILEESEEQTLVQWARMWRHSASYDSSLLALSLVPTLACNFDCKYCFERFREPVHMTPETEDLIVEFARKHSKAKQLALAWFGGEPLLRFETMCQLTNKLQGLGLPFVASLTTNGYLLDDAVAARLEALRVVAVQITIDGLQAVHDQRRHLASGAGSYDRIMSNIDRVLERWPGEVNIRINIDKTNEDDFPQLYRELKKRFAGQRVTLGTGMVLPGQGLPEADCHLNRNESCEFHFRAFREHGIGELLLYPSLRLGCMATHKHSWVIGPRGELYKCLQDVGNKDMIIGSLAESHTWNRELLVRYLIESDPFEHSECRECLHLPMCSGGCANVRVRGLSKTSPNACCVHKDRLTEYLETYLEIKNRASEGALQ